MIPGYTIGILIGNVKITCGAEGKVKWMHQLWISLVVVRHEDVQEIVLPFRVGLPSKPKDLAGLPVSVNDVEMVVWPEAEPAQLAQFDMVWQAVPIKCFSQFFARFGIDVDVVAGIVIRPAVEAQVPDVDGRGFNTLDLSTTRGFRSRFVWLCFHRLYNRRPKG